MPSLYKTALHYAKEQSLDGAMTPSVEKFMKNLIAGYQMIRADDRVIDHGVNDIDVSLEVNPYILVKTLLSTTTSLSCSLLVFHR